MWLYLPYHLESSGSTGALAFLGAFAVFFVKRALTWVLLVEVCARDLAGATVAPKNSVFKRDPVRAAIARSK